MKSVRSDLRREIKRLRRCLGFTQTPEERRERRASGASVTGAQGG